MSSPEVLSFTEKVEAACRDAAARVVRVARASGTNIIIWEDGAIRYITPDEAEERIARHEAAATPGGPNTTMTKKPEAN